MLTHFLNRLLLILLSTAVLEACTTTTTPEVEIATILPSVIHSTATTPAPTATAVLPAVHTPIPPTASAVPLVVEDWPAYVNDFFAYQINYPPGAQIEARGVDTVSSEWVPAKMTEDEYLVQLRSAFPDTVCLSIVYQQGFVTVLVPRTNGGQFVGICGIGGLGVYDIVEKTEDLTINGQLYTTTGMELWQQDESAAFWGGFFSVTLTDGSVITYGIPANLLATASGSRSENPTYEDYLVLMETLRQIVSSYRSTGTPLTPLLPQSSGAGESLKTFLTQLYLGNYEEAAFHYGGDYDWLREVNPNVPKDDAAALLARGCEVNGLVCLNIARLALILETGGVYTFSVQFANEDGSLFTLSNCCGDDSGQAQDTFEFHVVQSDDQYLVQELPPYRP